MPRQSKVTEKEEVIKRDLELENVVGNLLVAEYQVEKLRSRLADITIGAYGSDKPRNSSSFTYKHRDGWYKITVKVEQMTTNDSSSITIP